VAHAKLCGRRGARVGALPSSAGRRPRDAWQRPFPPGAGAGSHDARTLGVCKRSRSWRERSSVRSSASVRVARGLARPVRLAPGFSVTSSSALSIGKSVIAEEALHAGIWAAAIHLQGQSKYEQINLARSVSALRFILRRRIGGRDPASCASASMNRAGAAGSVTGGPQRPGGDVMRQGHHRRAGATQWIGIGLKRAMKRPCINCRGLPAARPNERRCSSH
jgi:hypothetical protein